MPDPAITTLAEIQKSICLRVREYAAANKSDKAALSDLFQLPECAIERILDCTFNCAVNTWARILSKINAATTVQVGQIAMF